MFWFCYYEASLTCNIIIVAAKKLTLIYFKGLKTVIKNQAWRLCEFFRTRQPLKNRGFQGHVHDVPLSSHFARSTVAKWCKELLKSGQNPSPHLILWKSLLGGPKGLQNKSFLGHVVPWNAYIFFKSAWCKKF